MKLSEKLKSLYSSENTYTVLQLLQKMIEAVEDYELLYNLYVHTITVQGQSQGSLSTTVVKVITTSPSKFALGSEGGGTERYQSAGKIISIVGADETIWTTSYDRDSLYHYYAITNNGIVEKTITIISEEVTAL